MEITLLRCEPVELWTKLFCLLYFPPCGFEAARFARELHTPVVLLFFKPSRASSLFGVCCRDYSRSQSRHVNWL